MSSAVIPVLSILEGVKDGGMSFDSFPEILSRGAASLLLKAGELPKYKLVGGVLVMSPRACCTFE